jgi:acetolactate synthase-1/2/3 large subunit
VLLNDGGVVTGGEAIVQALLANGVDTVFGLPGAQMYPFFDAVERHRDRIRFVGARHEQGCAYAAFGYARSTGRPGVFSVVPGPGVLNAAAALCTAAGACAPVLCVTGQVPTAFIGRGRGHLHELADQLGTMRSIVKWAERIETPGDAPAAVDEAFRQMLTGRPGPVVLEMAWDVMAEMGHARPLAAARLDAPAAPDGHAVEAAARLLVAATRPMIILGSGAQDASAEVLALAEALDAPVASLRGGRGIVPEDHELGVSSYVAKTMWPETDALVGIGSRLEMPYMRWSGMMQLIDRPEAPPHLIRIDIDPAEMERLRPHVGIVADAQDGARALLDAVRRPGAVEPGRARPYRGGQKGWRRGGPCRHASSRLPGRHPIGPAARRHSGGRTLSDGVRVVLRLSGAGAADICVGRLPGHAGFGFQTALGVKVAHPDVPVVSITGDGGFMFGVQELATAKQYGIGLVTILFNNAAFGNVMRDQETGFGGRLIGSELTNPDFMALAASFGIEGHRVDSPDALRAVLAGAVAPARPVLIEVTVDRSTEVSPWPYILKW